MASDAREIVICMDMGMTGSVARWRDSQMRNGWTPTSEFKIPTKVAYDLQDNDGPPIAWGVQCDRLPSAQIKECFKAFIGASSFSNAPKAVRGAPGSQLELHRWVRDYLGAFCADIVAIIDRSAAPGWRDATVIWNFTVPGSWPVFPVVADFKRLAEEAVSSCFQNVKGFRICCDVTEATAAAQCLLVEGSVVKEKQYSVGNAIISCDIGGATTDVAISTVSSAGRLTTWPKLGTQSAGTVTIEKAFWLHASYTLRSAGAQNPDQLALEMVRSPSFHRARAEFMRGQSEEDTKYKHVNYRKGEALYPQVKPPEFQLGVSSNLCRRRDVFESFFTQFVQQVEAAVDEAINTAAEKEKHPTIIGFCGGGCQTLYVIKSLQRRYGDSISIIDHTQLAIQPEMATVIGSTLIWDEKKLQEFISQTSFGIETDDGIKWRRPEESLAPSKFNRPYTWVVNFTCSKHGSLNTHRIIAMTSPPALPNDFSDALRHLNSKSWTVQVDLRKEKGATLSWKRKYQVVCNIAGPWDIDFKAESLVAGQGIPCTVDGRRES